MEISTHRQGDNIVIKVNGRVDSVAAAELEQAVVAQVFPGCRLALDMNGVNYMSSAGLRALVLIYRGVLDSGGQIALVGLSERLRDVMSMTGFSEHFDIFETVDEAYDHFDTTA